MTLSETSYVEDARRNLELGQPWSMLRPVWMQPHRFRMLAREIGELGPAGATSIAADQLAVKPAPKETV